MDHPIIEIRGQRVPLTPGRFIRAWLAYQGGDYFEFRVDGDRWELSQSSEWDYHDASNVVGRGPTLQSAADDFARSVTRSTNARPGGPSVTHGCDLVAAPLDVLVTILGAATRLGHTDGRAGNRPRRGTGIAIALGLACWNGQQQLQLREAYIAGRQHAEIERRRTADRGAVRAPRRA
jgi:hypothetical protein